MEAVDGFGHDSGHARLAGTAGPREKIGMRNPAVRDGVAQRAHDVRLPDYILEGPRAPLPIQRLRRQVCPGAIRSEL